MKRGLITFSCATTVLLFTLAGTARADRNPDFGDDAKPILRMQPDLLRFVKENFEVKDTGYSRIPGDDEHAPPPPYIFRARLRGSDGPFNITLFIQPGPAGHILYVKDPSGPPPAFAQTGPSAYGPSSTGQAQPEPPQSEPPQNSAANDQPTPPPPATTSQGNMEMPSAPPAPASTPADSTLSGPTANTPSGPIMESASPNSTQTPSLAPPPDPAPAH